MVGLNSRKVTMALLINESGKKIVIPYNEGTTSFTLKQMQDYVGGGLVQYIPLNGPEIAVWCNEEGVIKNMKDNVVASTYLSDITGVPYKIVGPVVIFEKGDTDPDWSWLGIAAQLWEGEGDDV